MLSFFQKNFWYDQQEGSLPFCNTWVGTMVTGTYGFGTGLSGDIW